MGSERPVRVVLWLVTLFSPAFLVVVYFPPDPYIPPLPWLAILCAPLWTFASYGPLIYLVILSYVITPPQPGVQILIASLVMTSPVLLTTGLLELAPGHQSLLGCTRAIMILYQAVVISIGVILLVGGNHMFSVPVPVAAVVQYLRHRHLCRALGTTTPTTTEHSPTV